MNKQNSIVAGLTFISLMALIAAYFAPICMRMQTYALPLPADVAAYVGRVSALPGVAAWVSGALAENDFLDFEEPYRCTP